MKGDRASSADGDGHRRPLLSVEQEGALLLVWLLGVAWMAFADAFLPQYWPLPSWLTLVLLGLWLLAFFQWAGKGGVPPRW